VLEEAWDLLSGDVKAIFRIAESNIDALNTVEKFLAMCESEADATTCFARFRACKRIVVNMVALPLT
jgi:hypothetical protein